MSIELETIPLRLHQIRKSSGISQGKCAAILGISDRAYKNYELGKRELPLNVLFAFCENFDVELLWVLTGRRAHSDRPVGPLVAETVQAILKEFSQTSSQSEIEGWGKKGEYLFKQSIEKGTNPQDEAEQVFSIFK